MRWHKEPLVHFLLIGAALFLLYSVVNKDREPSSQRIEITTGDIEQILATFTKQWQRPPTQEEMKGLLDARIREEILYGEALSMGLDRDDTIIRRRLAQKFEFLTEDIFSPNKPSEADLISFFEAHRIRYRVAARLSFSHIYFNSDQRGIAAGRDAEEKLVYVRSGAPTSEIEEMGDRFLMGYEFQQKTPEEIEKIFGRGFAEALSKLKPGVWQGPIASGYGLHLVKVKERIESQAATLDGVLEQVKNDWIEDQRRQANEKIYKRLRERYTVVIDEKALQERFAMKYNRVEESDR